LSDKEKSREPAQYSHTSPDSAATERVQRHLDALYDLPEEYLQESCGHTCARGGSARDLLVHDIFHEKQHTAQVWNIRDELRVLHGWGSASLYPLLVDYYLSRAQLISSLFGLTDEQLEAHPPEGASSHGHAWP
jgi:hypothetical protein